jgi:putative proteasome-type protease
MSYCLGIIGKQGLVLASDSRMSAGADMVNTSRKMHTFVQPGERVLVLLTSGSLSLSQSVITLLRRAFDQGHGLAAVPSMYDAARVVGDEVRRVAELDREALERDEFRFNVNFLLGGQIESQAPDLYLIYPQGNCIRANEDSPYLQIGETKYGRPILEMGIQYEHTSLEEAARCAMVSMDSTMRANATVSPPIDLLVYSRDELRVSRYRRFLENDADLAEIRQKWEGILRSGLFALPPIQFEVQETPGLRKADDG